MNDSSARDMYVCAFVGGKGNGEGSWMRTESDVQDDDYASDRTRSDFGFLWTLRGSCSRVGFAWLWVLSSGNHEGGGDLRV